MIHDKLVYVPFPFETQNFSKYRPTSNLGHKPKAKHEAIRI